MNNEEIFKEMNWFNNNITYQLTVATNVQKTLIVTQPRADFNKLMTDRTPRQIQHEMVKSNAPNQGHTNSSKLKYIFQAPKIYNDIPVQIRRVNDIKKFKNQLKKYLRDSTQPFVINKFNDKPLTCMRHE